MILPFLSDKGTERFPSITHLFFDDHRARTEHHLQQRLKQHAPPLLDGGRAILWFCQWCQKPWYELGRTASFVRLSKSQLAKVAQQLGAEVCATSSFPVSICPFRAAHSSSSTSIQQRSSCRFPPVMRPPARLPPAWQQEEVATLLSLEEQIHAALIHSQRAQAYLEKRKIPLELAVATGVGYLPPTMLKVPADTKKKGYLQRWAERLIFPLASPAGKGYIGRSLWCWHPGMDENVHKTLLEQEHAPKRWIKTNPAGWFGFDPEQLSDSLILVEGAFDRLTLLVAGFQATDVIALVGTAAQANWFPAQVQSIILALDADEGGIVAMRRLADRLERAGYRVRLCPPPQDRWGKDWNERWQRIGSQSVWPLYEAYCFT